MPPRHASEMQPCAQPRNQAQPLLAALSTTIATCHIGIGHSLSQVLSTMCCMIESRLSGDSVMLRGDWEALGWAFFAMACSQTPALHLMTSCRVFHDSSQDVPIRPLLTGDFNINQCAEHHCTQGSPDVQSVVVHQAPALLMS